MSLFRNAPDQTPEQPTQILHEIPGHQQFDHEIDRLLAGLRQVQPPAGMDHRILDTLRDTGAHAPQHSASTRLFALPIWASALPAIVLVAAFAWNTLATHPAAIPRHSAWPSTAPVLHADVPAIPIPASGPTPQRTLSKASQPRTRSAKAQPSKSLRAEDELALREMRASSHPAPPLPLTKQERLLLRMARRRDPDQIALLDPEARERQLAAGRKDVQDFFEPTTARESQ